MGKKLIITFIALLTLSLGIGGNAIHADESLTLFTPYTGISVTPGETINYPVEVMNTSSSVQNLTFALEDLPEGWTQSITASGNDIRQLSVKPNDQQQINVEITIPLLVEKADYSYQLVANGNGSANATLPFLTTVSEQGTFKTELTSDQPNMEGHVDASFSYQASLKNRTADTQNYALSSGVPNGWRVQFRADNNNVNSVQLEPNETKDITINVTPPENAVADTYTIPIKASTSSTSAEIALETVITGSYDIQISSPSGKLSTDINAGGKRTVDLVVENIGTSTLTDVEITSSAPPNWDVAFDQSNLTEIEAGKSKTVKATITAPDDAIAGDYVTSFTAETPEASSDAAFRVSVETSTLWGFIGVFIIAVVIFGLYFLFKKYGRR
ncbi:NEW3 domain-containing protein [Aquibacillus koreensis]|uniref:NEW3 domain-containing protein n=1 Tax=Aquibacillus koreensis TaxID=279446 RepID=A0A9X3WL83_9BACI|nr:NEW3 domain-containing protein [Aquibacillus koreensis]MCT2534453.1 NEW3 domain-containing protein [Aquibacillus koreensis]MDC3421760.1 NEW3 domain-containing protein [Aquibacillus koreensis]